MRGLLALAVLVLVVYALVDCVRSRGPEVRGLPKALWFLIILLLPGVGALAWLLAGRGSGPSAPPQHHPGPLAPDDDPDFLWRLDRERRRARDEQRRGTGDESAGSAGGSAGPEPA